MAGWSCGSDGREGVMRERRRAVDRTHLVNGSEPTPPLIVDILLETRLDDIPDGGPCEVCASPTQKTFLEQVVVGTDYRVRAKRVAGYRCENPDCQVGAYSREALIESLTKASQILGGRGDRETARALAMRAETETEVPH